MLTAEPLPTLYTRLDSAGRHTDYAVDEQTSLRVGVLHERYRSADFALDGVAPDTIPAVPPSAKGAPNTTSTG